MFGQMWGQVFAALERMPERQAASGLRLGARVSLHPDALRRALAAGTLAVLVPCVLASADGAWAGLSGGTQRWAASYQYGGPAFSFAVGVSPNGSTVFVSGTTVYGSSRPGRSATLAYDASTGARKWVATYDSGSHPEQRDRATRLAVSPDGSKVFVTGASACHGCGGSSFTGWSTVTYDVATGAELWVARYAADGGAYSIAVSPDGSKVFVNGSEEGGDASATVAYDASSGHRLWVLQSADSPVPWNALAASPDSSTVFVAAMGPRFDEEYNTTARNASDGTERWSAHYPGWLPTALALSEDGSRVFVTGYADGGGEPATVAYDASTGTQQWVVQDERIQMSYGDTRMPLAVSPDGSRVFVSGFYCVDPCLDQPFVTVAYEAAGGSRLWVSRYRSGGRNYPNDLVVSPDGSKIFVTGQETMPCYSPCTVSQINAPLVAYDASSGNQLWAASYENNHGWALAVSPNGAKVYLAGTFTTSAATASRAAAPEQPVQAARSAARSCSPGACGYSTAAFNSGPGPGMSQDRDPSLRYDGWRNFFGETALGGAYRASNRRGDTVRFRTDKARRIVWLTHGGPNQGKARVRIDGRSKGIFNLYRPTASARSFTFTGLRRAVHTVEIEVLGTKAASSKGKWVAVDGFKVGGNITVESSLELRYGAWAGKPKRAASGGSYRQSGSSRAKASFVFTGRRVAWVTAKGPAYGRARVVIDGVAHTVDLYRRNQRWQAKIWYTGLSRGNHRITVRPLGRKHPSSRSTKVVLDAFVARS